MAESPPRRQQHGGGFPAVSIVFLQVGDPVSLACVASLAHPGGNLTGFTNFEPTMGGKWLELLQGDRAARARAPSLSSIPTPHFRPVLRKLEAAAHRWPWNSSGPRFAMWQGSRAPWQAWRVQTQWRRRGDAGRLHSHSTSSSSLRSQPTMACRRSIRFPAFSPSTAGCCPTELITLMFIGARHLYVNRV